ncbi:MAG: alpha/beta hydrolase [Gemmatimonadetes bacterium]|nr:alpha/beta hydrolase [Gemmatimonadota bacterium]
MTRSTTGASSPSICGWPAARCPPSTGPRPTSPGCDAGTRLGLPLLKTLVLVAAVLYLTLAAFAFFTADRQIFFPPPPSYSAGDLPVTRVATDDGARVAALHLPAPGDGYTILVSHGNAEDLGHLEPYLRRLHAAGFGVLAYDYRGYGLSSGGTTTTHGVYEDVAAVYGHAIDRLGIPPSRLILLGRSVGSGPATWLAARRPVAGLVIESGFTSAFRVVTRWPLLPFDRFPNLAEIGDVEAPVLVVHGTDDRVIPFSHGRRLHAAAREPKRFLPVEGAGHNDLVRVAGERYWTALREFAALLG